MNEERADWRPNPIVERDLAEGKRLERKRRTNAWILATASVASCPLLCFGTFFADSWSVGFLLPALAILGVALYWIILSRYSSHSSLARMRRVALRMEYANVEGWLVELAVLQGEIVTGRDVGTFWFEGDRLYFAGARTSFGLGKGDLAGPAREDRKVIEPGQHLVLPLRAETGIGPVRLGLRFVPPESELGTRWPSELSFQNTLGDWRTGGEPNFGQLPPFERGSDLPKPTDLWLRALIATSIWPMLALAALLIGFLGESNIVLLPLIGLLVAFWRPACSPRLCWKAIRQRRAFDQAQSDREAK